MALARLFDAIRGTTSRLLAQIAAKHGCFARCLQNGGCCAGNSEKLPRFQFYISRALYPLLQLTSLPSTIQPLCKVKTDKTEVMAEALGLFAAIIAVSTLAKNVVSYLGGVRNASAEVKDLQNELASAADTLYRLHDLAKILSDAKIPFPTVQTLTTTGGPLEQFRKILEALSSRLEHKTGGVKHMYKVVSWPLRRDEIKGILDSLERYKTLFLLALSNNQM